MALFPKCLIRQFVDGLASEQLEVEAKRYLTNVFDGLEVRSVERLSKTYSVEDAINSISIELAQQKPPSAGSGALFSQALDGNQTLMLHGGAISTGVTFGIDTDVNPRSRWDVLLHRNPLPLLEMRTYHGYHFKQRPGWRKRIIAAGAAVWTDGMFGITVPHFCGPGDLIYLLNKWRTIFVRFNGTPSEDAVHAGFQLRQFCRSAWERKANKFDNIYCLPFWKGKRVAFMHSFDSSLLDEMGADKLTLFLRAMGTDWDEWSQAG
jgi:hypothetical protein